ncbi:MAG: pilus assembly protein PilM [Pseudomonadota bacterium]
MQKILGLDIGTYSIKASLINYTYKNFDLIRFYETRYPEGSPGKDNEEEIDKIAYTLNKLFTSYAIDPEQVICTISGTKVSVKQITLPFKEKKKIEMTIGLEIENYIPFDIEDVIYDYQIISSTQTESNLIVGVVKKEEISALLSKLLAIGIDPRFVEIDSLNLANISRLNLATQHKCYAILDLGHSKTNICFIDDNKPIFIRTIMTGGKNVTEAIKDQYKISFLEAERLKHKRGFMDLDASSNLTDEMKLLGKVIKTSIDPLVNEITQTIKSFAVKNQKKVEEIYLCGGSYRLSNLPQYVSISTGIKCSPLKYLEGSYNKLEDIKGKGSVIPQSLASALSGISQYRLSKINFRKFEYTYLKDHAGIKNIVVKYGILAGIIFLLVIANLYSSYSVSKQQEKRLDTKITTLFKKIMPEYNQPLKNPLQASKVLKSKMGELKLQLAQIEPPEITRLEILKQISSRISKDIKIDVTQLIIEKNKIKLEGSTDSIQSVDKIIEELKKYEHFTRIEKESVKAGLRNESMRFSITIYMGE